MRVLVLTTDDDWSMGTRYLLTIANALAQRGETVTACYPRPSATAVGVEAGFPDVALRSFAHSGRFARWRAVRRVVAAARASAILVHGERDALLAALAIGRRGGVVRRVRFDEPMHESVRTRLASSRTRVELFGAPLAHQARAALDRGDPTTTRAQLTVAESPNTLALVSWPSPPGALPDEPAIAPLRLLIVPGRELRTGTTIALRAAAHLMTRHDTLRVVLVGDEESLQAARIHAASLGLADALDLLSIDAFLTGDALETATVWVTADGDAGALATIAAMTRGVPVIVPSDSALRALVAPRITGFIADAADPSVTVAELARLLADPQERRAMGGAAAARASRLHSWNAYLDRITDALARAAGERVAPRAVRAVPA